MMRRGSGDGAVIGVPSAAHQRDGSCGASLTAINSTTDPCENCNCNPAGAAMAVAAATCELTFTRRADGEVTKVFTATVPLPTSSRPATAATNAVFAFADAMVMTVPFAIVVAERVVAEDVAAEAADAADAAMDVVRPTGAASAQFAASVVVSAT